MNIKNPKDTHEILHAWRTAILNRFLTIAVIISIPAMVAILIGALASATLWPLAVSFALIELLLIALALLRKLDLRIRVYALVLIAYCAALINLVRSGLGGAGPLYLLVIPILVLILIGRRASIIVSGISAFLATITAILILLDVITPDTSFRTPWTGLTTLLMFLGVVMTLLILFYLFQERVINQEQQAHADLRRAQTQLAEQNVILEQKVQERTDELLKVLDTERQRTAELTILNSVSEEMVKILDMKSLTRMVGDKLLEVFNSDSAIIMLLDRQTDLIHIPYEYDKNEGGYIDYVEPFPLGTGVSSKVILTGKPLMLNTLEEELANGAYFPPEIIEKGSGFYSQSWLGVPIIAKERVLGLVALADARAYAFSTNHLRLLQTLSANMGVAIENTRLFEETQRLLKETEQRHSELALINKVQASLTSQLDLQAIYALIGERMREVFHVEVVDIVLYDPADNLMSMPYSYEKGDRSVIQPQVPYGFRLEVIQSREPLLINEDFAGQAEKHHNPILTGECPKSALFMPLLVGEQVRGVLSIQDLDREQAFTDSDVRLLQTLANAMSVAIENARLFDETEQRAAELTAINTVSAALVSELDLNTLIHLVGEQTRNLFNASIAYVALLDETSSMIHFPYTYGEDLTAIRYGEGLTSKILATNQPLLINQNLSRQVFEIGATVVGTVPLSYLGVPITVGGKAVGVLSVQSTTQEGIFTENDKHLLTTIAANVGIALQNARLFKETKHQEQLARETQRRMADIIEFLPDATLVVDRAGQVITWNRAMEEMTGVRAADMLGKGDYEYALPFYGERRPLLVDLVARSQEELAQNYPHVQQQGAILFDEIYVPQLRGGERYLQVTASRLNDSTGNMVGAIEIIRDVSEHRRAESELRETAEKLRLIFENAFDGIDIYEEIPSEGKRILVDCNDRYCEMAGRSREELRSVENTIVFQRQIENALEEADRDAILNKQAFRGVFSWIRPDGKENIIEYNAAPTKVGDHYYTIGLDRDITERVHTEEELRKARADAEQANAAKSAFLANMSHELRTPLNAIIGFTRIVRRKGEGALPEKQIENLDKVLLSAEHLLNLINTVLDIAKIEAGRMDVLIANFRIHALIDLCANTTQPLLKPGVALEKQVDETLTYVHSDQDKIRQIVLNLLSNAAKFTHAGKITLAARMQGENLCISVADSGIGISAEALPRIFKEFQQADNSTTRQYGGTGLGLSISRNLAHLLGGEITVESELGKGSIFTLVIPSQYGSQPQPAGEVAIQPSAAQELSAASQAGQQPSNQEAKKLILVIDDDPDAVYLLQENLNPQEYHVTGARDGKTGFQLARQQQPHAILLDIMMPGADGWQVLHDLKDNHATSHIPVILLTIVDKKALGFKLGAAAYLLKPLDPAAVRETLIQVTHTTIRRPKHVLVIDDDPHIADMLSQYLPEAEFKLESALDGVAGLAAVKADPPDIILLDLMMPRLDGFGFLDRLRTDPQTRHLPVIVISAKDLTQAESDRLRASVTLIMKKQGFQGEKLADEISNALRS